MLYSKLLVYWQHKSMKELEIHLFTVMILCWERFYRCGEKCSETLFFKNLGLLFIFCNHRGNKKVIIREVILEVWWSGNWKISFASFIRVHTQQRSAHTHIYRDTNPNFGYFVRNSKEVEFQAQFRHCRLKFNAVFVYVCTGVREKKARRRQV